MKFIFICPKRNMTFESAAFKVTENQGVISDSSGNKTLDAKVELNEPCPFCVRSMFTLQAICPARLRSREAVEPKREINDGKYQKSSAYKDGNRLRLSIQAASGGPGQGTVRHDVSV